MELNISDNAESKRYEATVEGAAAYVDYIIAKDNRIYLTHTEVPKRLEGKGIGSALVKFAFEDIQKRDLILVPLCPFVAAYIKRHPEWKSLVLKSINIV